MEKLYWYLLAWKIFEVYSACILIVNLKLLLYCSILLHYIDLAWCFTFAICVQLRKRSLMWCYLWCCWFLFGFLCSYLRIWGGGEAGRQHPARWLVFVVIQGRCFCEVCVYTLEWNSSLVLFMVFIVCSALNIGLYESVFVIHLQVIFACLVYVVFFQCIRFSFSLCSCDVHHICYGSISCSVF